MKVSISKPDPNKKPAPLGSMEYLLVAASGAGRQQPVRPEQLLTGPYLIYDPADPTEQH
jgi:hypothetical protein